MDKATRLSIVMGNHSPVLRGLVRRQVDEEQELCKLQAICRPSRLAAAEAEVEARADRIATRWAEMPDTPPEMTPRAAAARSVVRDVMEGLLPF